MRRGAAAMSRRASRWGQQVVEAVYSEAGPDVTPGLMSGPVNGVEPTADLGLDIGHRALRGSAAAPRLRTLRRSRQSGTSTSAATSTRRVLSTRPVGSSVAGGRRMSSTSPRVTVPARPAVVATGDRAGVRRRWRQRLAREPGTPTKASPGDGGPGPGAPRQHHHLRARLSHPRRHQPAGDLRRRYRPD